MLLSLNPFPLRPLSQTQDKSGQFPKFLVAIDGSEIADYSLNLAIHIAEKYSASTVDLIFVTSAPTTPISGLPIFEPMFGGSTIGTIPAGGGRVVASQEDLRKTVSKEKALVEERKRLVEAQGLNCKEIIVESDDVGREIIEAATKGGYNLTVLGSRGKSGIHSLILGSVSKKVARDSKGSVLIVKNKIDSLPRILVAFDGSPESRKALSVAGELGKKFGGKVNPVAVVNVPLSPEGHVMTDIDRWENEMKGYVVEAVTMLKAQGLLSEGKVLNSVDVARVISEEASKGNYDLIVAGNRGYGRLKSLFLGSVATGIADGAKTNVLIARGTSKEL